MNEMERPVNTDISAKAQELIEDLAIVKSEAARRLLVEIALESAEAKGRLAALGSTLDKMKVKT